MTASTHQRSKFLFFAVLVLGILLSRHQALAAGGIDCGCPKTGLFIGPDQGAGVEISQDSLSPNGTYSIVVTGTGPYDVTVRRVSDNSTVYTVNLSNGHWGFSPDDDRFLYHYDLGGTHNVVLVDLSVSPAQQRWSTAVAASSSTILFSPFGDYVMYAALTSPEHTQLSIIEARTGNIAHQSEFSFYILPDSGVEEGMLGWGFSPDSSSRSFVYAFATAQNSVQWQMINLQSHVQVLPLTLNGISSFWQFSACGDVLGMVEQTNLSFVDVRLYKTASSQPPLYSQTLSIGDPIELHSTASSHIVTIGATEYAMSTNTADDVCTIEPISLRLTPRALIGGFSSTGTVVLDNPAAAGGRIISLASSNTAVATVPSSVTVQAGDTSATFAVQTFAVDSVERAVISGTAGGVTKRDTLTVSSFSVQSLALSAYAVLGGDSVSATVTLTGKAGPGGKRVSLASGNPSLASVPAGLLIPEGSESGSVTVHTVAVAASDSVVLTATAGGAAKARTLKVLAFPSLRAEKDTVVGGNTALLFASLSAPAPYGGVEIQLQSSIDSIALPDSPGIIEERDTSAELYVETIGVGTASAVTITAVNAPFPTSVSFHVVPANLSSFASLTDYGCLVGEREGFRKKFIAGKPILFSIRLDGRPPAGGAHVSLSIDKPGVLALLDSTFIPASAFRLTVTCLSSAAIVSEERVILAATYRSVTLYDTVTIVPAPRYTFVSVHDSAESYSIPVDLNNLGEVLVSTPTGLNIWRNGVKTLLPLANGRALNDSGWIAGNDRQPDGNQVAYLYKDGTKTYIPHPNSDYPYSVVDAMNNRGDVALTSYGAGAPMFTIWQNGAMFNPGQIDPYSLNVRSINDIGQAAGWGDATGTGFPSPLPFLWDGSSLSLLPFPPEKRGYVWGMNNNGAIVGDYWKQEHYPGAYYHSWFQYENGAVAYNLPLPPWTQAVAFDINDHGAVVGTLTVGESGPRAFLSRGGMTFDLSCLTTVPSGWRLSWGKKINNAGEILGFQENTFSGVIRAFLLRPETTTDVAEHPAKAAAVPTSYVLEQNFPNPFNPSTTINYQLPHQSRVTLEIYNALGQKVAQLVNAQQDAGFRSSEWNSGTCSSGVYYYRLEAIDISDPGHSFTQVKKMLLIR